jgi:hypothetical protein
MDLVSSKLFYRNVKRGFRRERRLEVVAVEAGANGGGVKRRRDRQIWKRGYIMFDGLEEVGPELSTPSRWELQHT